MRTILHQILIIFIIVSYASCLPDSTTKWDKSKKTLSYDEDSLEGDDDSDDDDTTTTTLTDLEYSQNVIQLQLEINDTMDFDNIFVSDTTYYASTIDDVTFNRTIPKNKFPPSGSVSFNTNPIYVSSKPDDGETISARGVVTEINQNSKYVYVKVLYGTFHKDDLVSANYDYYSYQAKITKVTNFLTANQAMISLSPTIEPSSMASSMTYAVSPAFPAGMSVNYSTGVISGTPTEEIGREYTVSARNTSTGSSIESKMNFSITKDPSGLGVSNMLILVVNSTAAFRKFGYVSASKNCPDEIECSITRSDEEYPFGIIKEIISDTKMLVEVSMGEFKNYDLLDNNKVYANTETTVKHDPISVSVILTVDSPAAELDAFNYDVESTTTDLIDGSPVARNVKKVVYATKDPLSAVGNAASGTEVTAWGKGVVAYFDSTPPSGTATRMYIMATEGNFIKDLDLYNSWTDTTTDRGDIEFVEAQNLILRIMPYTYSQPTNGCSDVAYTTRTTCLQNVGTCYDDTVAPPVAVAVVAPKQTNCQVAGHRWAPNYYAWVGIENFSAGMEVSNQPVATGNCLGDTGPLCDGVGFVTYVDATNNDLYIRTAGDNMFGSDHTGTGESIDNENIWVNPKAKVGTSRSTHHFNMYVNRYFSAYTSLFEGQNVTFSASPALPDGLTLNQESGVISGKPENSSARAEYIITAQNANSTNATSFTFSMTVHSHLSVFSGKVGESENITPKTFRLHRMGKGYHNEPCIITSEQANYGKAPTYPEVSKTRNVMCFLEAEEGELYQLGWSFGAHMSSGLCTTLGFMPYSFYYYPYVESTESNLWIRNNSGDEACRAAAGATADWEYSINQGGAWTALSDSGSGNHGLGDYANGSHDGTIAEGGPNCDDGKYTSISRTYTVDENDACEPPTSVSSVTEAGGYKQSCVQGAIKSVDAFNNPDDGASGRLVINQNDILESQTEESNHHYENAWKFTAPINASHVDGQHNSNLSLANYISYNSCSGGDSNYGKASQYSYYYKSWQLHSTSNIGDYTRPFYGSNPFYKLQCMDGAYETFAEIYVAVREWDRDFEQTANVTGTTSTYDQEIDELFPGHVLPKLQPLDPDNQNNPDHLLSNTQEDPITTYDYNNKNDWDGFLESQGIGWQARGAVAIDPANDYNSCTQTATTTIAPTEPTNLNSRIPFPMKSL